jgi:hypothetical protein
MNLWWAFWVSVSVMVSAANISFQVYVYDTATNAPLTTDAPIKITSSFVDENGQEYFTTSSSERVNNGMVAIEHTIDLTIPENVRVFDQPNLMVHVSLLDDTLRLPMAVSALTVRSLMADTTQQVGSGAFVNVDYDRRQIRLGNPTQNTAELSIQGTLQATTFYGDGTHVYNIKGGGLSDDHSLEVRGSRTCAANEDASNDCHGDDRLVVTNTPRVGIHTTQPDMGVDIRGRVMFLGEKNGEKIRSGGIQTPLQSHQSWVSWAHDKGEFKAGYVSRNAGLNNRSVVALGDDLVVDGQYSAAFGGRSNTLSADYAAIIGGRHTQVSGERSVSVGSHHTVLSGNDGVSIGGENHQVLADNATVVSGKDNTINGANSTVIGNRNQVTGDHGVVIGDDHAILADHVVAMGNQSTMAHPNNWVINASTNDMVETRESDQVVWFAKNGVAINTHNATEALVVGGKLSATEFYGDGSQLKNVATVDYHWNMEGTTMVMPPEYSLGINTISRRNNRLNIRHGLVLLSSDDTNEPGTLSYRNGDLVGYGPDSVPQSLTVQDTDTIYTVNSALSIQNNALALATANADDYAVFNGQQWVHSPKTTWKKSGTILQYDRAVTLWDASSYLGRLSLVHPTKNRVQWISPGSQHGVYLQVPHRFNKNQPIYLGFNMHQENNAWARYNSSKAGYRWFFDPLNSGTYVHDHDLNPVISVGPSGRISFNDASLIWGLNMSTSAQMDQLVVDAIPTASSVSRVGEASPMIQRTYDGSLLLAPGTTSTVSIQIAPEDSLTPMTNHERIQLTPSGEFRLSHHDGASASGPMLRHMDGNMMVDNDASIGVFNESKVRQVGIQLGAGRIGWYPTSITTDALVFNDHGVGVRATPSTGKSLVINDASGPAIVVLDTPTEAPIPVDFFSQTTRDWRMQHAPNELILKNRHGTPVLAWTTSGGVAINTPSFTAPTGVTIKGDVALTTAAEIQWKSGHDARPVIQNTHNIAALRPFSDDEGLVFSLNNAPIMAFQHGALAIGRSNTLPSIPNNPTASLMVGSGTYVKEAVYVGTDILRHKVIKTDNERYDDVRGIGFGTDTGFLVTANAAETHHVTVSFAPHFSTLTAANGMVTPNGADRLQLTGVGVSVSANNIEAMGNDTAMDSFTFSNDLSLGGRINGDVTVNGTVTVNVGTISGDVSDMTDVPFPFQHVVTNNANERVDVEYVSTKNVGIGTDNPTHRLQVSGEVTLGTLMASSVTVNDTLSVLPDRAVFRSYGNMHIMPGTGDSVFELNNWRFSTKNMAVNTAIDDNYFIYSRPKDNTTGDYHNQWHIRANQTARVQFPDLRLELNDSGDLTITTNVGRRVDLMSGNAHVMLVDGYRMGINWPSTPNASVAVSGNVVVGESLSGDVSGPGPSHSLMVQTQWGINTLTPQATTHVNGGMVVVTTNAFLVDISNNTRHLIIQEALSVETDIMGTEKMTVNGAMTLQGGMAFDTNQLLVTPHATENDIVFESNSTRTLELSAKEFIKWVPQDTTSPMHIKANGYVGVGHTNPTSRLHIQKEAIDVRWSATQTDAQLQLSAGSLGGVIGHTEHSLNDLILSDNNSLETAGAVIRITASGNINVGYGTEPSPTDNARLDVKGDLRVDNGKFKRNNQVLTHMPVGSVVMWSGSVDALPEGWFLCTGVDDSENKTTSECNFMDQFVVGTTDNNEVNESLNGATSEVSVTGNSHTHTGDSHGHEDFNSVGHSHNSVSVGHNNQQFSTEFTFAGGGTGSVGTPTYTTSREVCVYEIWGVCVDYETRYQTHGYPSDTAYKPSESGDHNHTVDINHGHTATVEADTHKHTLGVSAHTHDAATHTHTVNTEPEYYTLAFIYLKGTTD